MQNEIARASYQYQNAVESREKIIVGVNQFTEEGEIRPEDDRIDDSIRKLQAEKLAKLRAKRNNEKVNELLIILKQAAREDKNLMPVVIEAVENYATLGESRILYGRFTANTRDKLIELFYLISWNLIVRMRVNLKRIDTLKTR